MDRRSFLASLIGGLSIASLGGVAAASAKDEMSNSPPAGDLPAADAAALDKAEADHAQYYYRRRRRRYWRRRYYWRRPYRRYYRRRYYRPYRRFDWRARSR